MSTLRHTVWLSGSAKDPPTENVHIFSVRQEEREREGGSKRRSKRHLNVTATKGYQGVSAGKPTDTLKLSSQLL